MGRTEWAGPDEDLLLDRSMKPGHNLHRVAPYLCNMFFKPLPLIHHSLRPNLNLCNKHDLPAMTANGPPPLCQRNAQPVPASPSRTHDDGTWTKGRKRELSLEVPTELMEDLHDLAPTQDV